MQINSITGQTPVLNTSAARSLGSQWVGDFGSGPGPLSHKEYEMIKSVTGMDFNWPPQRDELFPELAAKVANAHWDQMASGAGLKEFTSASMLAQLHKSGAISLDELSSMTAYLRNNPNTSTASTPRSSLQPGVVNSDGSIYL